MKILKIVSSNDGGGVFTCEKQFIRELKQRGVTVDIIIIGNGASTEEYESVASKTFKIPELEASYGGPVFSILSSIVKTYQYGENYSLMIANLVGNTKYDALIYRRPMYIHLAGKLAKKIQTKVLWHLPSVARTALSKNYYNFFCSKYNIIQVANSHYTKSTLGEQCRHVVYPGFDANRIKIVDPVFKNDLKIKMGAAVYGIAARMHEYKAQDIVVDAFVKSEIPAKGGHLLIAGGPLNTDFAREVKKKAGQLLDKQIHFLGPINNMSEFYSSVDIIVNGRTNAEPFGISIAEAIGASKPVIAYKLGGPSEMIINGKSGWLVDYPTVQSYKEAFDHSIQDKVVWDTMGKAAKKNSHKFTVQENVSTLVNIIKDSCS